MVDKNNAREMLRFYAGFASKMTGSMVGIAISTLTDDKFMGAAIGTTVAHTLDKVSADVIERNLSKRQNIRLARVFAVARLRAEKLIEAGHSPRNDDFFTEVDGVIHASEVTEASFQAAINAAEEKKVDFIGALLANIAFKPTIDAATAHLLIQTAETMTLRSMVLLKIASEHDGLFSKRPDGDGYGPTINLHSMMIEAYNLERRGIIEFKSYPNDDDSFAILGFHDIDPASLCPTTIGKLLYENLGLTDFDKNDKIYQRCVDDLVAIATCSKGQVSLDNATTAIAYEPIGKGLLVSIFSSEEGVLQARLADARRQLHAFGFAKSTYGQGQKVLMQTEGELQNLSGLVTGKLCFLSQNGQITQEIPHSPETLSQIIGPAISTTRIKLDLQSPILL